MSDRYVNPLCSRYASAQMQGIFSEDRKFSTWRRLWVALAEAQQELGLDISDQQIEEMRAHVSDINYQAARDYEAQTRHDVMAHIMAFGDQCPRARPIIHLGATSAYVGDNTDIILQKEALGRIKDLLVGAIAKLCEFARLYKGLPCLGYTHFQPAQPTTVGKRACLWIQDLLLDLDQIEFTQAQLRLLGCRGTTGTAASFLHLFGGDHQKVKALEEKICRKMGFTGAYGVSGQTYSRKVDYFSLSVLSGIAQSAAKFSNDLRLLSHLQEIEEPFEEGQVGSSAMAYKRNPMRSERIASLARYIINAAQNPAMTASSQWLERTLDDSANRRIAIPEAFLAADGMLSLVINVAGGLEVYPHRMARHLEEELPFMATENILMYCVSRGKDRQSLHERIRVHSMEASKQIKAGGPMDLLERIGGDPAFGISGEEISALLEARQFTGRSQEQCEEFLAQAEERLGAYGDLPGIDISIRV
ncbi:MAG: adenylosuccinate lyase [Treponema sp.]|nr:adenylosuccinate lyase [Treponema sp.]